MEFPHPDLPELFKRAKSAGANTLGLLNGRLAQRYLQEQFSSDMDRSSDVDSQVDDLDVKAEAQAWEHEFRLETGNCAKKLCELIRKGEPYEDLASELKERVQLLPFGTTADSLWLEPHEVERLSQIVPGLEIGGDTARPLAPGTD